MLFFFFGYITWIMNGFVHQLRNKRRWNLNLWMEGITLLWRFYITFDPPKFLCFSLGIPLKQIIFFFFSPWPVLYLNNIFEKVCYSYFTSEGEAKRIEQRMLSWYTDLSINETQVHGRIKKKGYIWRICSRGLCLLGYTTNQVLKYIVVVSVLMILIMGGKVGEKT